MIFQKRRLYPSFGVTAILFFLCGSPVAPAKNAGDFKSQQTRENVSLEQEAEKSPDIAFLPSDKTTGKSPDLRLGDPFEEEGEERPRFFYDSQNDIFYTKIYCRIHNTGKGAVQAESVTVCFSYLEGEKSEVGNKTGLWKKIGETVFQARPSSPLSSLKNGEVLYQKRETVWKLEPGEFFPVRFMLKAEILFPQDADRDNNTAIAFYDLSSSTQSAAVAFALDFSPLAESPDSSTPPPGTVIKEGAKLLAALMERGYRFGVYSTNRQKPGPSGMTSAYRDRRELNHDVSLSETKVVFPMQEITGAAKRREAASKISGEKYEGPSALGQGLIRAEEALSTAAEEKEGPKSIVVLSAGLQEKAPYLAPDSFFNEGKNEDVFPLDAQKTFEKKAGMIRNIVFGPALGWAFDWMSRLRDQTNGNHIYGASSIPDLAGCLFGIRGEISQMIYYHDRGRTAYGETQPFFEVHFDGAARTATVALSWPRTEKNAELICEYRLKGESEWSKTGTKRNFISETASVNTIFGYRVFRFIPGADTTWEFRVSPVSLKGRGVDFAASVFSEADHAELKAGLEGKGFKAGEPLKVTASLITEGKPEIGASVYALIRAPQRSFSNILRRHHRSFSKLTEQRRSRVAAMIKKIQQSRGNEKNLYPAREIWLKLEDDGRSPDALAGDGVYTGRLPGDFTQIPGVYQVVVKAAGTLPVGRVFSRYAVLSTVCGPGAPDPDKSRVVMGLSRPEKNGTREVSVTIFPSDRFGNAVFPGSADRVGIYKIGQGSILKGGITDNLDSTFSQKMTLQPERKAEIEVRYNGLSLGAYSTEPFKRHEAAFHFGVVAPEGSFDRTVTSGNSLAVDYTYRLTPRLSLKSEVCCNRFDNRKHGVRLFYNATSFIQYRHPLGVLTPYFQSGIGFYSLDDAGQALGYSAGLGLYYTVNKQWKVDFSFRGHRVGRGLDLAFIQTYLAVVYTF